MSQWLKQSTAATIALGPFVDDTDGKTAETGLTIAQADIRLSKNGAAFAQSNNAAGATHMENGFYSVPLDTTDTGTLGRLRVAVSESGALPVWMDFEVVPANVWDSYFGADLLQVDLTQWVGDAPAALVSTRVNVSVGAMASSVITGTAINSSAVDKISDGVWDEVLSGHTTAGTGGKVLADAATAAALATVDGIVDDILADTGTTLPATLATIAAYIDTEVAAILEDTGTTLPAQIAALNNIAAASVLAAGDIDGFSLEEAMKLCLAALAGKLSGAGTGTEVIRAADDSKARITGTVDVDGNRTAITLDAAG